MRVFLGCRYFPFITLNISCHFLLPCRVSAEELADSPLISWGFPCMLFVAFPLLLLMFSLSLTFVNLIAMCLGVFLLGLLLYGTLCASWTWVTVFFSMLGKFSAISSSNIFSGPFSLSSSSETPVIWMLVHPFFSWVLRLSLWSLLWTLSLVDCLSPLHSCYSGILSCFFVWNIFLCCLILFKFLFVFLCMY